MWIYIVAVLAGLVGFGLVVDKKRGAKKRKDLEQFGESHHKDEKAAPYTMENDQKTSGWG
ncbi:hypothetical protein [Jeotgalibacillus aurantiacus]|uniref:hypothetical protein n=1 Tax=Jeotgalibacillus aurantiacus TaxID=2763266 RepID=UPI001D0B5A51|nr:hypothetical protein [Jeotgalibacillus aurantiacus]